MNGAGWTFMPGPQFRMRQSRPEEAGSGWVPRWVAVSPPGGSENEEGVTSGDTLAGKLKLAAEWT